jgi:hypothetical protein
MKVTPANRMLNKAARAKLKVSEARRSRRAAARSPVGAVATPRRYRRHLVND